MSNDNVLLTQGGYIFPGNIGPYQPSPMTSYSGFPPQNILPSSSLVSLSNVDYYGRYSRLPPVNSPPIDVSSTSEKDFCIIPWDELKSLLPEDSSDFRVESGLLSDGRAFAQRSPRRDAYFLFPSKSAYILYFTHYYFSRENLDRDQTIRGMMLDNCAIAIEKIIEAPRLASINTTIDDMKVAVESGSNILCVLNAPDGHCYLRRIDGYPGSTQASHNAFASPAEVETRASFNGSPGRGGLTERSVPSTSADLEFASNLSAMLAPSLYGVQGPNPINAALMYSAQNAFIRPGTRPPSAAAPIAAASAINTLNAAMAGMNLGQPAPPPHHLPPTAPQIFTQLATMPQQLAATFAAINQRNTVHAFSLPFGQNPFSLGQGRSVNPTSNIHQSQIFQHQQQHRRTTPPPPQTTATNVAANSLNFQLSGAYNFQNLHEPASSTHFVHGFPAQAYDSWVPEVTASTLVNNGIHLQYSPHIMAWPQQNHPTELRTASSTPSQYPSIPLQQQPIHIFSLSTSAPPVAPMSNSTSSASLVPPSTTSTSVATTMVTTSVPENGENALSPSTPDSTTTNKNTSLESVQLPSNRDDSSSSKSAVKGINSSEVVSRKTPSLTQQVHSRPNSSGSGKVKFKSNKGGHYQRVTYSNKSSPNASVGGTSTVPTASSKNATTLVDNTEPQGS